MSSQEPTSKSAEPLFAVPFPTFDRRSLAAAVKGLSAVSSLRGACAVARQWLIIGFSILAVFCLHHWAVWVFAIIVIATRQHALAILMHEATHYRLLSSRWWNDLVSDFFCAFPLGLSTTLYRHFHFLHHRWTATEKDPERSAAQAFEEAGWPRLRKELAYALVRDLAGLNFFRLFSVFPFTVLNRLRGNSLPRVSLPLHERIYAFGFVLILLALLIHSGAWLAFAILWLLPMSTVLVVILRIRGLAEHSGLPANHELNVSRSTRASVFERFLFAPCNVNFHLEHHLFPTVPYYNLPKLHAILAREPVFCEQAHCTEGYVDIKKGVFAEITMGFDRTGQSGNSRS